MSKFKVGDKVMVKYIPGVWFDFPEQMVKRYPELGEVRTITSIAFDDELYLDESMNFYFSAESLELVSSTPRTLFGLEIELSALENEAASLWTKIWSLRDEISKLKESEEE